MLWSRFYVRRGLFIDSRCMYVTAIKLFKPIEQYLIRVRTLYLSVAFRLKTKIKDVTYCYPLDNVWVVGTCNRVRTSTGNFRAS